MPIEPLQTRRFACGCLVRVVFVLTPGHYLVSRLHCAGHARPNRWVQVTVTAGSRLDERIEAAPVVNPATVHRDTSAGWPRRELPGTDRDDEDGTSTDHHGVESC